MTVRYGAPIRNFDRHVSPHTNVWTLKVGHSHKPQPPVGTDKTLFDG